MMAYMNSDARGKALLRTENRELLYNLISNRALRAPCFAELSSTP
jgi:hypothetical protein